METRLERMVLSPKRMTKEKIIYCVIKKFLFIRSLGQNGVPNSILSFFFIKTGDFGGIRNMK